MIVPYKPLKNGREAEGFYGANIDWDEEKIAPSTELHAQMEEGVPVSAWQTQQIQQVLKEFSDVFSESLRRVQEKEHHIIIPPGKIVWVPFSTPPLCP